MWVIAKQAGKKPLKERGSSVDPRSYKTWTLLRKGDTTRSKGWEGKPGK